MAKMHPDLVQLMLDLTDDCEILLRTMLDVKRKGAEAVNPKCTHTHLEHFAMAAMCIAVRVNSCSLLEEICPPCEDQE